MLLRCLIFLFFCLSCARLNSGDRQEIYNNFLRDMLVVDYWDRALSERLPVTYNHLLLGGYLNMPSARMGQEGEIGAGFSDVPPYRNYNLRFQLADRLEVSGNYRIFKGVEDPILTPLGFGDLSDKGANIKVALFHPEDSQYHFPGIAFGFEDFMGTRNFTARYIVATQVFLKQNLEITLGYGDHRIRGLFGGFSWMPFRQMNNRYLKDFCFVAEYDAIPYHDQVIEKHPKGRIKKSSINVGIKYRLWDQLDLSLSYVRGTSLAVSASTFYNFGMTKGLIPKIDDPLPYQAPVVTEPIGPRRPEEVMIQDFAYALREQGFELLEARLASDGCGGSILRLEVLNVIYYLEREVEDRLTNILAYLTPVNIDQVEIVIISQGFPVQEYHFPMWAVRKYAEKEMGRHELRILTSLKEVTWPVPGTDYLLFKQERSRWELDLLPKTHTLFGSARGKFKYAFGIDLGVNGFLWDDIYYSVRFGWILLSDMHHVHGVDRLNPSQLPQVRTDVIRYYKQRGVTLDQAYMQKNWNFGRGWFGRLAAGYFEEEYAGVASEGLYYPVDSCWAVGLEGALFLKRNVSGLGFTDEVRQLEGFALRKRKFTFSQYFLNFYYDWKLAQLDFQISGGKFLANDYGVRYEISRYFPSGLRITIWYTVTNGHDRINGHIYHDKGVSFSMPLDIFYTHTDRTRWGYGMSAWLRDVGVSASTGDKLYSLIREQRN